MRLGMPLGLVLLTFWSSAWAGDSDKHTDDHNPCLSPRGVVGADPSGWRATGSYDFSESGHRDTMGGLLGGHQENR